MKKVTLKVNGRLGQVVVDPNLALIDLLRGVYNLTSVKQSCDRKGQCGACTVIVDGKAVRSCLLKVGNLEGADIISVEGLGTPDNPHLIQEAFVLTGAIQCGFCTPGMIMAAKALLDANPDPGTDEIKKALRRNLCRCTGYTKIIEAVKLAGRFLRGEITPDQVRPGPDDPKMGVSHPRPSAMIKACGVAEFSADVRMPGALELAVVRSPYAHANIRDIDTAAAEKMPGVVSVITAKDIKGTNRLKYLIGDRQILCSEKVQLLGDAVAVVAAKTREQALAAVKEVKVDYEPLPVLSTPEEAMAPGAPQIHSDRPNFCYKQPVIKGDAEKAFGASAAVIESRFKTQINHQAPLEPEASIAYLEGEGEDAILVVMGRSINIHLHMATLQEAPPVRHADKAGSGCRREAHRPGVGCGGGQRSLPFHRERGHKPRPAHAVEFLLHSEYQRNGKARLHQQPVGVGRPRRGTSADALRPGMRNGHAGEEDEYRSAGVPPA